MKQINNKTAIITGASSGIGKATAKTLAAEGVNVALAARRKARLESLKEEIEAEGGNALVVQTDVTQRDQVENLADQTKKIFGTVDILINNAGLMPLSFMKNLHVEEWERMIDVNLKGVLYNIAAVLPIMRDQQSGHVINVSSVAGRRVVPGSAVYSATKFGVTALSEGMRMELSAEENIRITAIEPGAVDTELPETITDEEIKEGMMKNIEELQPLESADIANAIYYALTQPDHVNVNEILVMPVEQS